VAERYDVVVAGGGTAGCVLAGRLAERGRRVCLVEAGPDYGPHDEGRWPADMLDGTGLALSHAWPRADEDDRSQLRARILGGCSAHNACAALRGAPRDYEGWFDGWPTFFDRAERQLRVRRFDPDEVAPWHRAWAAAGAEVHPVNALGTTRWNAAFAYVDPVRDRLTILADTLVDRVLLDGRRARGAITSSGEVRADTVVLCAGAYGSPAILLRSGIDAGDGLIDHSGTGIAWRPSARLNEELAEFCADRPLFRPQTTLRLQSRDSPPDCWDLFGFAWVEETDTPGVHEPSVGVFAMSPYSRGRVSLRSDDPEDPPLIEHGFLADPRDVATIAEGLEQMRRLAASEGIARYLEEEVRPGADADLAEYVRAGVRGFFHPVATCAIGRVVDAGGRVTGAEGLVVGDASIIPVIPRANTNLTVAALAERLAETL
jgi:choline dehydrogenase-like flavoprotein